MCFQLWDQQMRVEIREGKKEIVKKKKKLSRPSILYAYMPFLFHMVRVMTFYPNQSLCAVQLALPWQVQ